MRSINAIIIDDEFQSRNLLSKLLLQVVPDVKLLGQAVDVAEAYAAINELDPDLIFLDVMMGDGTGFDLLKKFSDFPFRIIFITAHNEYAIKAFKYNAVDYLLKPVDRDELRQAVEKVRRYLQDELPTSAEQINNLVHSVNTGPNIQNKIALPTADGFEIIHLDEIVYCQSSSSYTFFYLTKSRKLISSYPLKQYDDILCDKNFFRVHKSFLVNLSHVKNYRKGEGGTVILTDGHEVEVSRRNKDSLMKIFKS